MSIEHTTSGIAGDSPGICDVHEGKGISLDKGCMLFVLNSLAIGGSETKVIKIANALALSDVHVELAYLNPPETALGKVSSRVSVTHLERSGKYSVKSLRKLRQLVYSETQVVIAVNLYPLLYAVPAVKLHKTGNARVVALVNTSEMIGKDALFARGYSAFLKRCDTVIFGSDAQRALWSGRYNLPLRRTEVVYNGVDHKIFSPGSVGNSGEELRAKLMIPRGTFVLGSVGRLAREKNFDLLLRALARFTKAGHDAYLVLVGIGEEQKRLERQAMDEGLRDRVRFCGLLDDVRPALSIMDVFVLPSNAVETFSNAALEAMAMARPVVLSEIGGAAEMVEHGKSGMLFPVGNIDALTQVLRNLYDHDDRRRALGAAARQRAVSLFGFDMMLARYRALLSE